MAVTLVIGPQIFLLHLVGGLKDYVGALMFIDNVNDTTPQGPALVGAQSQAEQFADFMRPPQAAFAKCLSDVNQNQSTCELGVGLGVSIFDVTNAEAVVTLGAKATVQEMGRVYVRLLQTKYDVNVDEWNSEGVAHYLQNSSYILDPKRCDSKCKALLETKVTVVNPVWAVIGWENLAQMVLFTGVGQGLGSASAFERWAAFNVIMFGAFSWKPRYDMFQAGYTDPKLTSEEIAANFATLIDTTRSAEPGCTYGSATWNMRLTQSECEEVIVGVQALLDSQWGSASVPKYTPLYGVGNAFPFFIKVTVREALGFEGAQITDPMTGRSASFTVLADSSGAKVDAQMASKFGDQGVSYKIGQMCKADPACVLADPDDGSSCTASNTCRPRSIAGYSAGVPGSVWGLGFPDWAEAGKVGSFTSSPVPVNFENTGPTTGQVVLNGGETKDLIYNEWKPQGWIRSLDNCSTGTMAEHTCGLDCDGPPNTVLASGAFPFYLSAPFFNNSMFLDPLAMNLGQNISEAPYLAHSRSEMTPCTGSDFCSDKSRYDWLAKVEPQTGKLFDLQVTFQLNGRIGVDKNGGAVLGLPPMYKLEDSLIPVAWSSIAQGATAAQNAQLIQAQSTPDDISYYRTLALYVALGLLVASCLCGGCIVWGLVSDGKKNQKEYEEFNEGEEEDEEDEVGNAVE